MSELAFDYTVSIEGAATALGVIGAAIGYLTNLVVGWIRDWKDTRYRGTRLVILELLEKELFKGLSEVELDKRYRSEETEKLRKKYSAWKPKWLDKVEFERELKQLQFDHMIDLIGMNTYRIRHDPIDRFEQDEYDAARRAEFLKGKVEEEKIIETALRVFTESKMEFNREDAAKLLIKLESDAGVAKVIAALDSDDDATAISVADTLLRFLRRER